MGREFDFKILNFGGLSLVAPIVVIIIIIMSFYPIKPLLAYGGSANMLCTGKTLWGRKPVSLGVSQAFFDVGTV